MSLTATTEAMAGLNFVLMKHGLLSVMNTGITRMQVWYAINLDTQDMVSNCCSVIQKPSYIIMIMHSLRLTAADNHITLNFLFYHTCTVQELLLTVITS